MAISPLTFRKTRWNPPTRGVYGGTPGESRGSTPHPHPRCIKNQQLRRSRKKEQSFYQNDVDLTSISNVLFDQAYVFPKTKYTTLGPKFYTKLVLPPKCYFWFVNPYFLAGSAAFVLFYAVAVSKPDLKQFSKSDLLGFAGGVFMDFCPQRAT